MSVFRTTDGYEVGITGIFNGVSLLHLVKARHETGHYRILGFQAIESLWCYFVNPQAAILEEVVRLIEPDETHYQSGLMLISAQPSYRPDLVFVSDEEISALHEYHEYLDGSMPQLPA